MSWVLFRGRGAWFVPRLRGYGEAWEGVAVWTGVPRKGRLAVMRALKIRPKSFHWGCLALHGGRRGTMEPDQGFRG